ncbi:hypothetical protein [Actinoallomurus sp. NPDC050550]
MQVVLGGADRGLAIDAEGTTAGVGVVMSSLSDIPRVAVGMSVSS